MQVSNSNATASDKKSAIQELQELRTWRRFFSEVYGQVRELEEFRSLLSMDLTDAMSAVGLGNQEWPEARWQDIHNMFV